MGHASRAPTRKPLKNDDERYKALGHVPRGTLLLQFLRTYSIGMSCGVCQLRYAAMYYDRQDGAGASVSDLGAEVQ